MNYAQATSTELLTELDYLTGVHQLCERVDSKTHADEIEDGLDMCLSELENRHMDFEAQEVLNRYGYKLFTVQN